MSILTATLMAVYRLRCVGGLFMIVRDSIYAVNKWPQPKMIMKYIV